MNSFPTSRPARAFTLVEMLAVIAIIGILAALLLPVLAQGKARARRIWCESNLEQVGITFHIFASDHGGKFPMQVPMSDGGSEEFVQNGYLVGGEFYFAFRHFQVMSNTLGTPRILICPADTREPATGFGALQNSNVSFFVGVNADAVTPRSILAGDRNLTNSPTQNPSIIQGGTGGKVWWTQELHQFKGNVLFADTHVEEWNNMTFGLNTNGPLAEAALFLPSVKSDANQFGPGLASSSPGGPNTTGSDSGGSGPADSNSGSGDNAGTPATSPPAAPMNGQPNQSPDNSSDNQGGSRVIPPARTQSLNSSNPLPIIIPPATPAQSVANTVPPTGAAPVMSPFDRQVVKSLQTFTRWGYLLLLLLLLLLLWESRRRRRRQQKRH